MQLTNQAKKLKHCEQQNPLKQKRLNVSCSRSFSVMCITVLVSMLMACALPTKQVVVPVVHNLHDLPANLAAPCGESQDLKSGTGAEVLSLMIDDRRKLVDCRHKHGAIVDLWRDIQDKTKALK